MEAYYTWYRSMSKVHSILWAVLKKKTSRVAPARDKDVLVNNFMPSDFTIVENDAQPSSMENSSNSKNKQQSLSVMNAYSEESFASKNHLTVPTKNRTRKASDKNKIVCCKQYFKGRFLSASSSNDFES